MKELPFNFADSPDLRILLEMCNPAVSPLLVGSDALGDAVQERFVQMKEVMKEVFRNQAAVSITCDAWTSPNRKSILGATAHWIDESFQLQEVILCLKEIDGEHTGINIANHLIPVL